MSRVTSATGTAPKRKALPITYQMHTARLNTNTSDEFIEIHPERFEEGFVDCSVCIRLRNWNSRKEESWTVIKTDDISLSVIAIRELQNELDRWLMSQSVGISSFSGHFSLGHNPSNKLDFHFEQRADTIASADKPVVTIEFSSGTTHIEFRFVTDQSCLGLFAMTLSQLFNDGEARK